MGINHMFFFFCCVLFMAFLVNNPSCDANSSPYVLDKGNHKNVLNNTPKSNDASQVGIVREYGGQVEIHADPVEGMSKKEIRFTNIGRNVTEDEEFNAHGVSNDGIFSKNLTDRAKNTLDTKFSNEDSKAANINCKNSQNPRTFDSQKINSESPVNPKVTDVKCILSEDIQKKIDIYKDIVEEIVNITVQGELRGKTYNTLAELTDTFGHRMTCSQSLNDSINWVKDKSNNESLGEISSDKFPAPFWVRNHEHLTLLEPRNVSLKMLGLGSSVGTGLEGLTAEVLVVRSFRELDRKYKEASGKIIVFNPEWTSYDEMVQYRTKGASYASKYNASASLVRSVTPFSINTPHTGWQDYDENVTKIPTACITSEDAEMLQRMYDSGNKIIAHLYMEAENRGTCLSENTIIDVKGSEKPDEYVVVSGHLDSWDVGVGAMDDGGGVAISWMVPLILKKLGLTPRRTIRTILFTGEEQGLIGGKDYYERHKKDNKKYQLLLESDIGTFDPQGLSLSGTNETLCIMQHVVSLLKSLRATKIASPMEGGPDLLWWKPTGVPLGSLLNKNDRYFWFHHSEGDTMEVEDSDTLDRCAAMWAAVAFIVADMNITLPQGPY